MTDEKSKKTDFYKFSAGCLILVLYLSGIAALVAVAYRMYIGW
jgi:hypothetical protein